MRAIRFALVAWAMGVQSGEMLAADSCRQAAITAPSGHATTDARPEIQWEPIAGEDRYRLRLESRVPEGLLVESIDVLVEGLSFQVPRPLTDYRARVKLLVVEACDPTLPVDDGHWFMVDTASTCVLSAESMQFSDGFLIWRAVDRALDYEVRAHLMPGGKLLTDQTTSSTGTRLDLGAASEVVAAVRPRCPSGYGDFVFVVVPRTARQ